MYDLFVSFIGELSLSGELRPCFGVLASVISARNQGFEEIFVPAQNADEVALVLYAPDGVDMMYQKEKISWQDHERLFSLAARLMAYAEAVTKKEVK